MIIIMIISDNDLPPRQCRGQPQRRLPDANLRYQDDLEWRKSLMMMARDS